MIHDIESFRASLQGESPPSDLSSALRALWYDARGDWNAAHRAAQDDDSFDGAWVHAYLHRKEGDLANAGYWYRQAGRPMASGSLDDEWVQIVRALLATED
ncbi:MAG: hypothetical protein ACUVSY_17705 [Roseiflexus sp.]